MQNSLFRKKAMNKLASPEQLDRLVVLVSPKEWLAVFGLGLLVCMAILWGIYGELHSTTMGSGILLSSNQMRNVYATSSGKILELTVSVGDKVKKGQIVATVAQPDLAYRISAGKSRLNRLRIQLDKIRKLKQSALEEQLKYFTSRQGSLENHLARLKERLKTVNEHIKDYQSLANQGVLTKSKFQEYLDDKLDTERQIGSLQGDLEKIHYERENSLQTIKQEQIVSENQLLDEVEKAKEELNQLALRTYIKSSYSGYVLSQMVSEGQSIESGTPLFSLTLEKDATVIGVAFFAPADGKKVKPGMTARISPATVKAEEYGSMVGLVTEVSEYPVSMEEMRRIMQNAALAESMMHTSQGAPFRVNIKLLLDPDTPSGYRWTSSFGPPIGIESGTPCVATVITEKYPPMNLIMQLFKKTVFGEGHRQKQR
jgi:HlyD family secretion protein